VTSAAASLFAIRARLPSRYLTEANEQLHTKRSIRALNCCLVAFGNWKRNTSTVGIHDENFHFVIGIESRHEDKSVADISARKHRVVMHCDHTLDVPETVGFFLFGAEGAVEIQICEVRGVPQLVQRLFQLNSDWSESLI
jgi:hypothetical protein